MKIYCCECKHDVQAILINGTETYPHRPDLANLSFWKCPNCNNFVGCHHKTNQPTKPLGVIPNAEIKHARQYLHNVLDPVWKNKIIRRHVLYKLISKELGYEYHTAEIKTIEEARKIYHIIMKLINWAYNIRTKKNKSRAMILKQIIDAEENNIKDKHDTSTTPK